jgi:hypothetical protein
MGKSGIILRLELNSIILGHRYESGISIERIFLSLSLSLNFALESSGEIRGRPNHSRTLLNLKPGLSNVSPQLD